MDNADLSPISFSTIRLKNSPIGNIANENGHFVLNIPLEYLGDSIIVTAIGYGLATLNVLELSESKEVKIRLSQENYSLDKIFILSDSMNELDIFRQAQKDIPRNFSRKPYYLNAFFRELSFKDRTYNRLIEASIGIFDRGQNGKRGETQILIVNEVIPSSEKKRFEKVKKKEMEKEEVDLYKRDFEYNQTFWDTYNYLPISAEYNKAIKDLESKGDIKDQFKKNDFKWVHSLLRTMEFKIH